MEQSVESRTRDLGVKPDGSPYSVFVVDDSEFMVQNLTRILSSFGCRVVGFAKDGEEALEKYRKDWEKIDIVTLDITMPKMNGLETLAEIMKINPQAKVIICSALGYNDIVKQAILGGAKHFIVKPFKREVVFEVIKTVLARG